MLPSPTREKLLAVYFALLCGKTLKSFSQTFFCIIKQYLRIKENVSAK